MGKGETARSEQFLLSHCVLYPLGELSAIFIKFEIVFQFGSLKFVLWESVNMDQMIGFVFDEEEKIVGKGENIGNQHFLLFPQCLQKTLFLSLI